MELLEDGLVNLGPGLAHGGVGDRLRLRQGHLEGAALGPQLGQRRDVALAAGGEHEAEHEQHHEQGVEHAAVLRQRVQVHVLGVAPGVGAALGAAHAQPVGGAVAGAAEALRIDERLQQDRPPRVAPLPVGGQLPRRQRQRLRRQEADAHPGEQQKAGLGEDEVQMLLVGALRPVHPGVAAEQRAGRLAEQQAAQPAPVAVEQEVAQMRAQRLFIAEVVVALDKLIPQAGVLRRGQLQAQRQQVPQPVFNQRLGSGARGQGDRLARPGPHLVGVLGGQRQDAGPLEPLQQAEGGRDPVAAGGRAPAQVLADRLRQLLAAQRRERRHRLLDVSDLAAREAPAEEGGRLEILDARVHGSSQETSSRLPWQIPPRMSSRFLSHPGNRRKSCPVNVFEMCQKITVPPLQS